jgi:tetratricopeptide (TPR) repeat protein
MTFGRSIAAAGLLLCLLAGGLCHALESTMDQRLVEAEQVYRTVGPAEALPEFSRLLKIFEHSNEIRNVALANGYIGACHWRLGNYDQARQYLDTSLALKREIGDRLQEGKTLNVLGLLEWDLGNFDQAVEYFATASKIGKEVGDPRLEGATLNNLSLVYDELGDYKTSLSQYHQVLNIYSDADFPRGMGDTLGNIGGVYLLLGQFGLYRHGQNRTSPGAFRQGTRACRSRRHAKGAGAMVTR